MNHLFELPELMTLSECADNVVRLIWEYGDVDGSHHKQWLLDQILRELLTDEGYAAFIAEYEKPEADEIQPDISWHAEWDRGIAP